MKAAEASTLETRTLFLLLISVSVALGWILWPFYGTIMWGVIIALLFAPLNRRLQQRLGGRRTPAALLTLLIVLVIVIIPFALITASLASEASALFAQLQSGELNPGRYFRGVFAALPDWMTALLDRFGLTDFSTLQRRLTTALTQASQLLATQALSLGQITFDFVASIFIALYLAFFLIRDGELVVSAMRRAIPLTPAHQRALFETFATVIRATV